MNTTWEFSGREYYFDVSEYECMKKMGKALSALRGAAEESEKKSRADKEKNAPGDSPEAVKAQCVMIRAFFSDIFGDEAAENICGAALSGSRHGAAYMDFIAFVDLQVKEVNSMRDKIKKKYASRAESLAV